MAHRKEFEGRMLAILDPDQRRVGPGRTATASLVGGLAVLAVLVSAASPVAPVSPTPAPTNNASQRPVDSVTTIADHALALATPKAPANLPEVKLQPDVEAKQVTNPVIQAADSLPRSERVALLARLLREDSSASVRRVAAWGLRDFADEAAASAALGNALNSDQDSDVRTMAAWALQNGHGAAGTAALVHAAHTDTDDDVRETSVWALAESGDTAASSACRTAITADKSENVRTTCAWALGYLRAPHTGALLVRALRDSSDDVREAAAWALGEVTDATALPALRIAMQGEKSADVLKMEMRALIRTGEDPSQMVPWLRSSDPEIRQIAASAIAGGASSDPMPRPRPRPIPFP
jgi:HEAT repeat protein